MSSESRDIRFQAGQKVTHTELGEGVVLGIEPTGFIQVYFRLVGERQVPADTLQDARSWNERLLSGLRPATREAVERLWLALEAAELPLMDNAATLTSARVDLLPHQVVLVHRVARAQPRRFLIADEVGLGKTIETALILRELASRGEMKRALMIVPAGLVENWRRELNEVFNLDFEVFGSEGDITDRKTNAFARHNLLIASIDTLKRTSRVKRLLNAPSWDLVVFDEAHHLSVYKTGKKIKKTENFKLAEALREHCRDLLLLSATPHQGDHFRFWMLIRLLEPSLFHDELDMVENRHRLNAVVVRRTKADACTADGSPIFARRVVHTEGFSLSEYERTFYDALNTYLQEGYNLAARQGNKGRALGFVMTIFQKIAASSFAAVRATLQRRLLMLTVQEAIERDEVLDVDGRDRSLNEARTLICQMYSLGEDAVERAQAEQILADAKVQLLKKRNQSEAYSTSAESYSDSEFAAASGEETITTIVSIALPEERRRIRELLEKYPNTIESKTHVLLQALHQLWSINSDEKVVIFTTYLGSVESIRNTIEATFPGKGVVVLKGGDHGSKTAVQKRFRRKDGPRVLISTAAGREGINLQFARILFNYDLPWNPMDLEQRIGRIHRYGQTDTAQVYNLVATDTIEGGIFLMLEEKLLSIAQTLGKVDEHGQVAEDLRIQVLGQLGSRLSYDRLYQDALSDPSLKRTRQEIDVAMSNAMMAREVVFALFQDLDRFDLSDYQQFDDAGRGMQRLLGFVQRATHLDRYEFHLREPDVYELVYPDQPAQQFTTDRERALQDETVHLIGLEHPFIRKWLDEWSNLLPEERALVGRFAGNGEETGLMTVWQVVVHARGGKIYQRIVALGLRLTGERSVYLERMVKDILLLQPAQRNGHLDESQIATLLNEKATSMLHRELMHTGVLDEGSSYSSRLLACVVVG